MTYFFGDGFDLYAQPQDAWAGYWDSNSVLGSAILGAGRFPGSRALGGLYSVSFYKTSGVNDSVHHFNYSYMMNGNPGGSSPYFFIQLLDGATVQCSVYMQSDGAILLTAGAPNSGTTLAYCPGMMTTANVWVSFEIEVVVHNTSGSITIRKNGNPNNDFFLGGLDTTATANNYANKILIGFWQNPGYYTYVDDFLWRSESGTVPWVGDIRCYTRRPNSDAQAQLSRTTAPLTLQMWAGVNVTQAFGTGTSAYYLFTAPYSGLLTGVTLQAGTNASTGSIKVALFSDLGNNRIGSVLATASELTLVNSTPSVGHNLTFPTPAYVAAGQNYWIGLAVSTTTIWVNVVNNPTTVASMSISYAAFPVSNPSAAIGSFNASGVSLTFTTQSNADAVSELYQDGTTSYVYSNTNGQNDLYNIGSINASPMSIVGVTTRGFFEKSDSGTRNATVQLKSGGTTVQGVDTALTTSVWGWIYRNDRVDPATSAPWTVTAVNGVQIGPKVTA